MKKLVLVLLVLGFFSCSEQEEDEYCNSSCWTVQSKRDVQIGDNLYQFSIRIVRNCSTDNEWKRVYLNNTSELSIYSVGDVLCGNEVPE